MGELAARDGAAPAGLTLHSVMQMITPGAQARKSRQLLVYLHVPFCSSKCHFCDWVVGYPTRDLVDTGDLRERYVDALCAQIAAYGPRLSDLRYTVTNIYWGGGTPTRLEPRHLTRIHATLASAFDLSSVGEHTAECSPETLTAGHLEAWKEAGLNRLSIGVQSFDDTILRQMGRAHDATSAAAAIEAAQRAGLENFNIDLIAGFPGQGAAALGDSIQRAIDLGVPHISLYVFREFAGALVAVRQADAGLRERSGRDEVAAQYLSAKAALEAAGYAENVVGYFARTPEARFDGEDYYFGMRGDYIGFGAGASSTLGRCSLKSGAAARYGDSQVRDYLEDPTRLMGVPLSLMPDELYLSTYFKAFATREGIRWSRWNDQFGFRFQEFLAARPAIREWFTEQEQRGARFVETERGIALTPETWVQTMIWRR